MRKRISKTKKLDETINVKRTRKTYDENVNQVQTRQHENISIDRRDQNILFDFDKNILIERNIVTKRVDFDALNESCK